MVNGVLLALKRKEKNGGEIELKIVTAKSCPTVYRWQELSTHDSYLNFPLDLPVNI